MNKNDLDKIKVKMAILFKNILLSILVPIILGSVVFLGHYLALRLSIQFPKLGLGVAAFGGGVILATIKDIAKSLPSIFDYIKKPTIKTISAPSIAIFIASFSLFASYYALENSSFFTSPKLVVLNMSSKDENISPAKDNIELSTIHLNFTKPVPSVITGDESPITFYVTFREEGGTSIHDADANLLENLLNDLSACSTDVNNTDVNNRVQIEIRGFASSSDWKDVPPDESEKLNLALAHNRAEEVKKTIKDQNDGDWYEIEIKEWENLEEMELERNFSDRMMTQYSQQMGRLNRRVEIRLIDVANCQSVQKEDNNR